MFAVCAGSLDRSLATGGSPESNAHRGEGTAAPAASPRGSGKQEQEVAVEPFESEVSVPTCLAVFIVSEEK